MAPFVTACDSDLPPTDAWARVTDWARHGDHVPLTTVSVGTPAPPGVHTVFTARTAVGRLGFDDPMEVVAWQPPDGDQPGRCRLEKRGRVMLGWAEITVEARPGGGSRVTWREDARPAHLPGFAAPLSNAVAKRLFTRVLRGLLAG